MSYQMFIWPLADHFHQVLELLTVVSQLMLLVCFTNFMGEGIPSNTLGSVIVGTLLSDRPPDGFLAYRAN